MDLVKTQNLDELKNVNPLLFRFRRDLSATPTNCLLYDNSLVITVKLNKLYWILSTINTQDKIGDASPSKTSVVAAYSLRNSSQSQSLASMY